MNSKSTGEFIKKSRKEAGLIQKELAETRSCTDSYGNKKTKLLERVILALFCLLLLLAIYVPIATMSPSDMMGVIFFHVLSVWVINFLFGFTNSKLKWLFPVFTFAAYCPVAVVFQNAELLIYALLFLISGYVLILIVTGIRELIKLLKKRLTTQFLDKRKKSA